MNGYECFEEVYCTDTDGSNRFVDILAFDTEPDSDKAYIIDPTIRYETNEDLEAEVQMDKQAIYDKCIPDLQDKYRNYGPRNFEVIGLWFGGRGTISNQVVEFFDRFKLDRKHLPGIAESILTASIRMVHYHIYG